MKSKSTIRNLNNGLTYRGTERKLLIGFKTSTAKQYALNDISEYLKEIGISNKNSEKYSFAGISVLIGSLKSFLPAKQEIIPLDQIKEISTLNPLNPDPIFINIGLDKELYD